MTPPNLRRGVCCYSCAHYIPEYEGECECEKYPDHTGWSGEVCDSYEPEVSE